MGREKKSPRAFPVFTILTNSWMAHVVIRVKTIEFSDVLTKKRNLRSLLYSAVPIGFQYTTFGRVPVNL